MVTWLCFPNHKEKDDMVQIVQKFESGFKTSNSKVVSKHLINGSSKKGHKFNFVTSR